MVNFLLSKLLYQTFSRCHYFRWLDRNSLPLTNSRLTPEQKRYNWRTVFDMLEYTYDLHQPVMFSVRASLVDNSFPQLLWLLDIRRTFSLHIWRLQMDRLYAFRFNQNPYLNKSLLIEGDVFLRRNPPAAPVMIVPHNKSMSLTFKQWLKHVSEVKKAIKVNFKTTEVVKPALQYLFASKSLLQSPVILHANIWKSPDSYDQPVNGQFFVTEATKRFPDATISVGWTETVYLSRLTPEQKRYNWRTVFDMLEYTYDLHQPVMFSVRASLVDNSFPQLFWLLDIRRTFSLHIWSNINDVIDEDNWNGIVALRKYADPKRILYDLTPEHTKELKEQYEDKEDEVSLPLTDWRPNAWKVIQFINPSAILSTIITSERSPAFLGWPTAFLLSERRPTDPDQGQIVSGKVMFVPKRNYNQFNHLQETGLSIFLLTSVRDVPSPRIKNGIHIFIGFNGRIFIENRNHHQYNRRLFNTDFLPKAVSQMVKHNCYGFAVTDYNNAIELSVYVAECWGNHEQRPRRSWYRNLRLEVPKHEKQRHVLIQKAGDATVDLQIQDLVHTSSSFIIKSYIILIAFLSSFLLFIS